MTLDEIRPFGDRILVRPDAKHAQTEGGLHIPETVLADNPNYYYVSGVVVKLGDGYREDVYECCNQQCRYESRRTVGEYCPVCKATQKLAYADSGVHQFDLNVGDRVLFGRFAGKQIEVEAQQLFSVELHTQYDGLLLGISTHEPPIEKTRYLLMREVEVLGVLDTDARVTPGYEAAKWNKPTKGLTPEVTTVPR